MTLFPIEPRPVAELTASGLDVIDRGFTFDAKQMLPLFSGGNDSQTACHLASQHPRFSGEVHHINTGIGAKRTRQHVEAVCLEQGWKLNVYQSPHTYERFVRERGFPGPGRHHWIYVRIKERCIRQMLKGRDRCVLLTGCRSEESKRRMGHVEPVKHGERYKDGRLAEQKRVWTAPCHDWSREEQLIYMQEHDLTPNPLNELMGMSGECFCGAYATPGELNCIRTYAPDVAQEIDRLTAIAEECGTPSQWGRPPDQKGLLAVRSGPLCSRCDIKAAAAGLLFTEPEEV